MAHRKTPEWIKELVQKGELPTQKKFKRQMKKR